MIYRKCYAIGKNDKQAIKNKEEYIDSREKFFIRKTTGRGETNALYLKNQNKRYEDQ